MQRKSKSFLIVLIMIVITGNINAQFVAEKLPLIPAPLSLKVSSGVFKITSSTTIQVNNNEIYSDVEIFNKYIEKMYGFRFNVSQVSGKFKQQVKIFLSSEKSDDGYSLVIDSNGIFIEGGKGAGVFYALQTLIQLLPPGKVNEFSLPFVKIDDEPRFKYRGMHLDVARHFFSVDVVKRYIDHLALYKMNYFHWHLTDDQGWRIEIKKYPKLKEISAWRKGTLIGHLGDKPEQYDTLLYGGIYTQEQIKEVVQYANARHITIVPEIEMPGHALAALAAYPQLSCTGGPFEVGKTWGVIKDVFCPKEETFIFLQDVLDEVCELFPGKYIHIGGDECPKDRWKECSHCQALMKKEDLANENELQRYFTNRIAAYLKSKNKSAIGWDEILENGLDSNAVVMSYRGYNGGASAAIKGHDVVMAPASHTYFDQYQSRYTGGRIAIGGYLPIEQVYGFEPVPDVLDAGQAKHILGAQGNVWTEYIADEERLNEMIFPRMSALAEVLWLPKENRSYNAFTSRLLSHFKLLAFQKLKYSTSLFDISAKVFPNGNNGIFVELFSNYSPGKIYYTFNATTPTLGSEAYSGKIPVDQSVGLRAALFEGSQQRGEVFSQVFNINKATGKEVILANPPHVEYSRGGALSLVDGATGNIPWIPSEWLGFQGKDLDANIDLGTVQTISRVTVDVLRDEAGKIYLPKDVTIFTSENGKDFNLAGRIDNTAINKMERKLQVNFPNQQARWIKVVAKNSNGKDWLFVDEIQIE